MSGPIGATCLWCPHAIERHGSAGCVGSEERPLRCYCPLDWNGQPAETCARIGCNAIGTHVDPFGQFFCPDHPERGARAFADIESWEVAS